MIMNLFITFLFSFLEDISPFGGSLIPLFWISDDVSSGFQSQSVQPSSLRFTGLLSVTRYTDKRHDGDWKSKYLFL